MNTESKPEMVSVPREFLDAVKEMLNDDPGWTAKRLLDLLAATPAPAPQEAAHRKFFSYSDDGFLETFDTLEKAAAQAEISLNNCRDEAPEGWSEEVVNICYGEILGHIVETEHRPAKQGDQCFPDCADYVDYALVEVKDTPEPK